MHDIQATALATLKYVGLFVSLISGMVATAFETKEDDGKGSKRLSRFGKIVFSCVVLGSLVSIVTQLLDDHQKRVADAAAAVQRKQDVERITYIIDGTERIAHRIDPITWTVYVRYRIVSASGLNAYVQRILQEHPGTVGFDLVGEYLPKKDDPTEAGAWKTLMQPSVYIGVIKPEVWHGDATRMPVPILHDLPILFSAHEHADKEGTWTPGPDATVPPFYSRMSLTTENGTTWLKQQFVVRDSPEATQVKGVISPLDISGYQVVAEGYGGVGAYVDSVDMLFPSANRPISVQLTPSDPIMGFNRSVGVMNAAEIRSALNIAPLP